MRLSQALIGSLCCLGLVGCATMGTQTSAGTAPAPVVAGPDSFAAPPPPDVSSSVITVAPGKKTYSSESGSAPKAPVRRSSPKPTIDEPEESGSAPGPSAKAPLEPDSAAVDTALLAQPVRKGSGIGKKPIKPSDTDKSTGPQSAVRRSASEPADLQKSAEVVPVSNPAVEKIVDSRLSS